MGSKRHPVHPGPWFQLSVKNERFLDHILFVSTALICPRRNGIMLKFEDFNVSTVTDIDQPYKIYIYPSFNSFGDS